MKSNQTINTIRNSFGFLKLGNKLKIKNRVIAFFLVLMSSLMLAATAKAQESTQGIFQDDLSGQISDVSLCEMENQGGGFMGRPLLSVNSQVDLMAYHTQGLSCESLRSVKEVVTVLNVALLAPSIALRNPKTQQLIAMQMARYGLTLANPTFLTITVIGAAGVTVGYFMIKKSIEECDRQDRNELRQEILSELEYKFNFQSNEHTGFQVVR